MKVLTVVGTRPEIIRMSRTIALLDESLDHVLVHTGQNSAFQLNDVFFNELGVRKPDYFLDARTTSVAAFIADALERIEVILRDEQPDAFLLLGDTNSALTAIMAKKMHIPIYHLEAGNRSFDANVPEEVNRTILDHLSDFNFPYSEAARRNLIAEGLPARRLMLTGSPMLEVFHHHEGAVEASDVLDRMGIESQGYFIVSAHRQENVDTPERLSELVDTLTRVQAHYGIPMLISTHPRTRSRLESHGALADGSPLRFHEPFGFFDYVRLQRDAFCVLSDSGTVSEESSMIGFPAVTLRSAIERPEAQEPGVLVLSDLDFDRTVTCIDWIRGNWRNRQVPVEYQIGNFSHRVVAAILSTAPSHKFWSGLR
ncbi:MAG: UDP-N-acetylglucosamine 2-epimerase (non-hydrolyzing) [Actinobacteria bacterium]|nr:UDP-N-acetylglucosamine 2-epimerase (non-hydrolyzing) [Actinomycetota bacterium]